MSPAGADWNNSSPRTWSTFLTVRFSSGVFLVILALATIIANGALLMSMRRNAMRCLRTPTSYFFVSLGVADLLTGMLVESTLAICHLTEYGTCRAEMHMIQVLPPMVTNASFLIVLLMSVSQYLAISHPHTYRWLVNKRRVALALVLAVCYATAFSALKLTGLVSSNTLFTVEVCFHSTFVPFLLVTFYVMVLVALRKHTRRRYSVLFRKHNVGLGGSRLSIASVENPYIGLLERHFIRMNMLLIVTLLVCTLPSIVVLHILLNSNSQDLSFEQQTLLAIAQDITDDVLFLKFVLDPLIFAWRVRKL